MIVMKSIMLLFAFCIFLETYGHIPAKKPLTIEDYKSWNALSNTIVSADGKRMAYEQNPQRGDGKLILKYGRIENTFPRGYKAAFSPESDYMVFGIKQPEQTLRDARTKKVSRDKFPKDSLGILVFSKGNMIHKFPRLGSFRIPEENARWIAFTQSPDVKKDTANQDGDKKAKTSKHNDLVLFNVETADTLILTDVKEWIYAKKGSVLFLRREKEEKEGTISSLEAFFPSTRKKELLFSAKGWMERLVIDDSGEKYAFLFSSDTIKEKIYSLYIGMPGKQAEKKVDSYSQGIPVGWSPSRNGIVYFSNDGTKLYFGTAESPRSEQKDSLEDEEKPILDIWSWNDEKLQSQQLVELDMEKKRTYLAVIHLSSNRLVQLADPNLRNVFPIQKGNGDVALGYNESPYLRETGWTGKYSRDYYLVDVNLGIKREIVDCQPYVRISPGGHYVIWYDYEEGHFYARSTDIYNLRAVPLTGMLPVKFFDEDDDRPTEPSPYGIAGWSEGDRFIYIYDRYDIWRIDPAGERVPVCITKGLGRRTHTRFRYLQLDYDLDYIPLDQPVLLNAFNEKTMSNGFYKCSFGQITEPELLIMDQAHFAGVRKAKAADKLIWTRENVRDFPDLWCSNLDFTHAERISHANPQQAGYVWPTVQMVEWTSFSGEKLKGLLYLPENINPGKKYPMLVYFYEKNSENLYRHHSPTPSRSTIDRTFFVSNGYAVFVPDITYRNGYPGQSAYNAVVSGTHYLLNTFPFLDEKKLGLQGQSWGGYQVAYLITQTDLFSAAMAGAPVSNMTSAYGGIRWQTGLVRMFQYERQQSRIGGSLWEKPLQYIENSPLFMAPKVNTPLLMMHNDADGAVPWSQGIEFFVALRRLNKPVWLLNYNHQPHNLESSSWANRMDLSKRMSQFFDHYLKGQPIPPWMEKGVPAMEKGKNLGY
jgi:dienelactone hydrolase